MHELLLLFLLWWSLWQRLHVLTHWGRVTHICVGNLTIIGSDNGLSPDRRQAIIWTNAGILLIGPWGTNFSKILIDIQISSFKKIHLKMSSAKWRPFCLGLNVLTHWPLGDMGVIKCNLRTDVTNWVDEHFLWNCSEVTTERIWSKSTLARVMACCQKAPNHYLIIWRHWTKLSWNPIPTGIKCKHFINSPSVHSNVK